MLIYEDETIQSRIIITSRHTFWESIKDNIDIKNLEVFKLKGFDNDKRKRYFQGRLQNQVERDLAFRISKQISGGIYDDLRKEDLNEDRPSGVPFILDLIARYVHDNPVAEVNPYEADPFAHLLEGICLRENRRQEYNIEPSEQFELFEELFRAYPQNFTIDDLQFYLEAICGINDLQVVRKFTQHAFLTTAGSSCFQPQYEVLRVYFLARYLANSLESILRGAAREKVAKMLAEHKTGKTQVMDWLVIQLKAFPEDRLLAALHHAFEIVNEMDDENIKNSSLMTLFHLINNLIKTDGKEERTKSLAKYLNSEKRNGIGCYSNVSFTGIVKGFLFENIEFHNCFIVDAEFRNCRFNQNTKFIRCRFEGTLKFQNCSGANEIEEINSSFSDEAEYSYNTIKQTGIREEIKKKFAEDVLLRALRKFRGEIGFNSIMYANRLGGLKHGNPYNEKIWDILLSQKIVERHTISNVNEGGLNVFEEKDIRSEIMFFLDNGVMGTRLRKIVEELIIK
jgi:hypothetical protein